MEVDQVGVERWRRTLLLAAAGAAGLWTYRLFADSGWTWTALALLLPWPLVPLVPLLVPRRDSRTCCVALGSFALAVELLLPWFFLFLFVPSAVVMVLIGVADRCPALRWVALAVVLLDLSGIAAAASFLLLASLTA